MVLYPSTRASYTPVRSCCTTPPLRHRVLPRRRRCLRVSAKYLIRRSGISPPSRLVARNTPAPRERKRVYHKSAQLWEMKVCECEGLKVGGAVTYHGSPANPLYLIYRQMSAHGGILPVSSASPNHTQLGFSLSPQPNTPILKAI